MTIDKDLMLVKKLKAEDREKDLIARKFYESLRPEIRAVAEEMEMTMRKHDEKKGDSWKSCDILFLGQKIEVEYKEVETEIYRTLFCDTKNLKPELIDLANVCMMLWNRKEFE